VINKIDIPEVREKLDDTIGKLRKLAGHTRIMGISAATGENVKDLMKRVYKVVDSLPRQTSYELFTDDEERVNFEEEDDDFLDCMLVDTIDRIVMRHYAKQFATNLKELGYEYDGDGWNIKSKFNGEDLTCYGVIWDYWYSVDTCVRESLSDIFEEEIMED
jgi:hypothetical protein